MAKFQKKSTLGLSDAPQAQKPQDPELSEPKKETKSIEMER